MNNHPYKFIASLLLVGIMMYSMRGIIKSFFPKLLSVSYIECLASLCFWFFIMIIVDDVTVPHIVVLFILFVFLLYIMMEK